MTTRRTFLAATGLSIAGVMGAHAARSTPVPDAASSTLLPVLPPLPYSYDALEPFIDAETMKLHHSKHHQAYVDGLAHAEGQMARARESGDYSLIQHWSRQAAFHGGGHALHSMFWTVMAPPSVGGGSAPSGFMADALTESFGSFDSFKQHFSASAKAVEGSGWALLHYHTQDKRLLVLQVENQHKLSSWQLVPILGIDVWEHAYYLKYKNDRGAYINNWWNVVNWKQVEDNLRSAMM